MVKEMDDSWDSSVGIGTGYGLDDRMLEVRFPARGGNCSMFRSVLGPTQPPIQWAPGALPLGVKRSGPEADHSPLSSVSSAEVKGCVELYLHSPNYSSWLCD
jgi:hypothetical protein